MLEICWIYSIDYGNWLHVGYSSIVRPGYTDSISRNTLVGGFNGALEKGKVI